MKIYCIGDSHAHFFGGKSRLRNWQKERQYPRWCINRIPIFKALIVGPTTAYNLVKEGSTTQGREKLFATVEKLPKNSRVMLVFGEIDCRLHLLKQARLQERSVEDVVNECVDRYFSVFLEIKDIKYSPIAWHVTPTLDSDHLDFPAFGTWQERLEVTKMFNARLSKLAEENTIPVITIFNKLLNEDGTVKGEYFQDAIHLNQLAMPYVLEEVQRYYGTN